MSEFEVSEGLLIKKAPSQTIRALILKYILRKYRVQASFMSIEGKMGRAVFVKSQAQSIIPLMIIMSKAGAISLKAVGTKLA